MNATLIDALTKPGWFPDPVERIETHISWVLLTGDHAYKIKKPLDLGFLDFSTLEKRRFYCHEEVRLNRRTAPDLYLDVVAIYGTPDRPRIDGGGDPIEYAVRMHRFETRLGFDRLLARAELEQAHVVDLARRIADLHGHAEVAADDSPYGTFEQVAAPMRENFDDLAELLSGERATAVERLRGWTERQLAGLEARIEGRLADGFVRECHGDAHLGNVTLHDGRATLFDCIEFSPELRWIDVISDLAFTVMDLHDRGAAGLGWVLLDEYLARTGDYDGLRLLPLYVVYRALVRAKVQGLARDQANDEERRRELDHEIDGYLRLAHETACRHRPGIIITTGLSGSGKSWLAERLVERAGLVRVRSDVERKRLHGLDPEQRSDSGLDSELYSPEATERTYGRLVEAASAATEAGMPVLIDAAFLRKGRRDRFRELAHARGVPFAIVSCTAPDSVLTARLQERERRGDDASEAGLEVLAHQQKSADPPDAEEREVSYEVDTRAADAVERTSAMLAGLLSAAAGAVGED